MTGGTEAAANKARAEASIRRSQKRLEKSKGNVRSVDFFGTDRAERGE
jgi:hypothetical protein